MLPIDTLNRVPFARRCVAALAGLLMLATSASSHPLGDFSINQYFIVDGSAPHPALRYLLDVAEIPSFTELDLLDSDYDSEISPGELEVYLDQRIPQLAQHLRLQIDGNDVPLTVARHKLLLLEGNAGMAVFNILLDLDAPDAEWPDSGPVTLTLESENYPNEQGTRECLVLPGPRFTDTTLTLPPDTLQKQTLVEQDAVAAAVYVSRKARFAVQLTPATSADAPLPIAAVADFGWTSTARLAEAAGEVSIASETRTALIDSGDRAGSPGTPQTPATMPPSEAGTGTPDSDTPGGDRRDLVTVAGGTGEEVVGTGKRTAPDTYVNRLMTRISDIVRAETLPPTLLALGLLVAAVLGMGHALSPGHGKTVMAAYLIGEQGTAWHALILGIVVTITHTWSVIALGLVTLYFKEYLSENQVNFWTGILSGAIIVVIGVILFRQRYQRVLASASGAAGDWRFYHGHEHGLEEVAPLDLETDKVPSYKSIFWLGVSGGVVPCPSALIVLLLALKVGRLAYGLALLIAFSIGLAAVLVAIGILVVRASRILRRENMARHPVIHVLPLVSAGLITLLGGWVVLWTLLQFDVLQFG